MSKVLIFSLFLCTIFSARVCATGVDQHAARKLLVTAAAGGSTDRIALAQTYLRCRMPMHALQAIAELTNSVQRMTVEKDAANALSGKNTAQGQFLVSFETNRTAPAMRREFCRSLRAVGFDCEVVQSSGRLANRSVVRPLAKVQLNVSRDAWNTAFANGDMTFLYVVYLVAEQSAVFDFVDLQIVLVAKATALTLSANGDEKHLISIGVPKTLEHPGTSTLYNEVEAKTLEVVKRVLETSQRD